MRTKEECESDQLINPTDPKYQGMKETNLTISVTGMRGFPDIQGGVETHCQNLYPRLADRGCVITVFGRIPYMEANATEYRGVILCPLPCPTKKFLETVVHTFKSIIKAHKTSPDILHIHAIGPSLFTPLARALGMRVVVTTHGPDYERAKWKWPAKTFLRLCERMGMTFAHEVIAITDNIATDVKKKYNRQTTVIPNGVDIPQRLETKGALEQFGLEKGKFILSVGRIVPEKGFHDLIEAFNRVGLHDWRLVIVGRADHEDAYSSRLKEQAAQNRNVVLTGFLKGIPLQELYSHAGLFVIPSYYEGLPIVLLEALSYGLSCIASDIPANNIGGWLGSNTSGSNLNACQDKGVRFRSRHTKHYALNKDELHKDDGSRFFRTGHIDDLSAKITEFTAHPLTDAERQAQIAMVKQQYNWDRIAEDTLRVYKRVIGTGKQ